MRVTAAFIMVLLCIAFLPAQDWHLKKNSREIAVYTRDTGKEGVKEIKAVTQQRTSLSSIVALLNDRGSYPQWMYKCKASRTLKKISDTEIIHYQATDMPWPADNRDFVVNIKWSQDPKTKTVTQVSTCMSDYILPVKNFVRIKDLKAIWTLTPVRPGLISIEYHLLVDPGGDIPEGIESLGSVEGPYQTMFNLKQWVMKPKYQKSVVPFISEPEYYSAR